MSDIQGLTKKGNVYSLVNDIHITAEHNLHIKENETLQADYNIYIEGGLTNDGIITKNSGCIYTPGQQYSTLFLGGSFINNNTIIVNFRTRYV